jgi:hypothetical protein
MKAMLAGLGSLILGLSLSNRAIAQEQIPSPQYAPQAQEAEPGPAREPMAPVTVQAVYPYPTVAVGAVPYAYPYAPHYGWAWPASPRRWEGYRYGPRVGYGWHAQPWHGGRVASPRGIGRGGYGRSAHRR